MAIGNLSEVALALFEDDASSLGRNDVLMAIFREDVSLVASRRLCLDAGRRDLGAHALPEDSNVAWDGHVHAHGVRQG